jgi:hypothetical protein
MEDNKTPPNNATVAPRRDNWRTSADGSIRYDTKRNRSLSQRQRSTNSNHPDQKPQSAARSILYSILSATDEHKQQALLPPLHTELP